MKRDGGPPLAVLAAFGAAGTPRALPGGHGESWRVGDVVLKPSYGIEESLWRADALATLGARDFRLARPVRSLDGRWVVDGWEASEAIDGREDPGRVDQVVRVGIAFHRAIADRPRPHFLDERDNPWVHGDRVAWDERPVVGCPATLELLVPLSDARRPVVSRSQLVHGDLLGNVLFSPGLLPAVIDWAPYWRPPAWALAVAVVDALCWHGAPADAIDRWSSQPEWGQMLVRALMFRIATREAAFGPDGPDHEPNDAYRPVVELAIRAATRAE
ncbi:MAG TPA: TIGR02569 family protein [Asanoa sp.]